jgi:DNA polymerase-3 subunit delta'
LKGALAKDRLPHGFLFLGREGSGQVETALELAKTLFCADPTGHDACGVCIHCRQIAARTHPDLVMLRPEGDSATIKIEAVRDLIAKANLRPFQARCKVFVIQQAECMNDVAQNALLKTLEEPQGKAYFILITAHPDMLLETIRSRTQTLNFRPLETEEAWDEEAAQLRNEVISYALGLLGGSGRAAAPDLSKTERQLVARVLDTLIDTLRDAMVLKAGANDLLRRPDDLPAKRSLAERLSEDELETAIERTAEFREKILNNINVRLATGVLWEALAGGTHVR